MADEITLAPQQTFTIQDLEQQVVAAALADVNILEYVATKFKNRLPGQVGSLFNAAHVYYNLTRGQLTRSALASILMNNEPDLTKHQDYLNLYDTLLSAPYSLYSEAERRWFLLEYDNQWKVEYTGKVLAEAAEAMRSGHVTHGKRLMGSEAAWQVLGEKRLDYESLTAGGSFHEVELGRTTEQAQLDYSWAVENKYIGVPLALGEVNDALAGLRSGDLYVVAGYAHEGKSFVLLNDAHAAWKTGKNVAVATGEMSVRKYRNRFIALHSCEPQFRTPLETKKIDRGLLTKEEHEVFLEVLGDIRDNPKWGKCFIFQFPFRATPSVIFNKFASFNQIVPLDMAVVDYLGLMSSERTRVSRREELDDLIREVKALALDFSDGRGVALEAAYQVNRSSFERARHEGYYTLSCFSDSAEVEKSADSALWLLSLPQNPDELKMGFVKNRDDDLGEHFYVRRNLKSAQLHSLHTLRGETTKTRGADLLDLD